MEVHIGKDGISEGVVDELKRQLKEKKIVKVRFLRSALEVAGRKDLAEELQMRTGAVLLEVRGNTALLRRR